MRGLPDFRRAFLWMLLWTSPGPAVLTSWSQEATTPAGTLWDVPRILAVPPAAETGPAEGLVSPVWYAGEPWQGKPTRIFAWLGIPETGTTPEKLPAVLLVHGGGGKAFKDWARHWAKRGYVALAMDTAGQGPDGKRHADAGPDQDDGSKFREFSPAEVRDMWTYHAVAAVLRGHAFLLSHPLVDAERTGVTGISWGGYLTCLTAGLDPKLKAAVPVYGCGYLGYNSYWRGRSLAALPPETRERWLQCFDPSLVISHAACPVLMVNGMHDFAYPPDSHGKTGRQIPEKLRNWSLRVDMAHGHIWTFPEVDAFMDQHLKPGAESPPLLRLGPLIQDALGIAVEVPQNPGPVGAALHFTRDTGIWQDRKWETQPVPVGGPVVRVAWPDPPPSAFFVAVTDARGFTTSTGVQERETAQGPR